MGGLFLHPFWFKFWIVFIHIFAPNIYPKIAARNEFDQNSNTRGAWGAQGGRGRWCIEPPFLGQNRLGNRIDDNPRADEKHADARLEIRRFPNVSIPKVANVAHSARRSQVGLTDF
jgi:hypothetical protein